MDLTNYLNKRVQIVLNNGFTYIGTVTDADDNSLTILDKYNKILSLKETAIDFIKETTQ